MYKSIPFVTSLSCKSELFSHLSLPLKIFIPFIKSVKVVKGKTPQRQGYQMMCEQYKYGVNLLNTLILNSITQDVGSATVNQWQGNICCKCRVVPKKGETAEREKGNLLILSVYTVTKISSVLGQRHLSSPPPFLV